MKFQDSSFNSLKVTVGTKSVTHARTHARSKSNMPHQLFQSWGHNYDNVDIVLTPEACFFPSLTKMFAIFCKIATFFNKIAIL